MDFKTGDKVVFKTWDELKEEFGIDIIGNIPCKNYYTIEMENTIDKTKVYTISNVSGNGNVNLDNDDIGYAISTDMIKHYEAGVESDTDIVMYKNMLQKDFSKINEWFGLASPEKDIYINIMEMIFLEKEISKIGFSKLDTCIDAQTFGLVVKHVSSDFKSNIYFNKRLVSEDEDTIVNMAKELGYTVIKIDDCSYIFGKGDHVIIAVSNNNDQSIRCFCELVCDNLRVSDEFKNKLVEGKIDEVYEQSLNKLQLLLKEKEEREFNNRLSELQDRINTCMIQDVENSLNSAKEAADALYERWLYKMEEVREKQGEMLFLRFDHTSDKVNSFIDALRQDRENVDILGMDRRKVVLRIRQPFLFFDETKWKNLENYVIGHRREAQHVIKAVMEKKCTFMFETSITMRFSANDYFPVEYFDSRNNSAPPNPHISEYNCWGDNKTLITQYILSGDFDMAYTQIKATLAGVNLSDSAVFPRLFDYFKRGVVENDWNFYNCRTITDNETGIQMTINEAENYYRRQEGNHEENNI